jgi:hypothetical protein
MKISEDKHLATLVYYKGLVQKLEEKYQKRIEYLVGANNELMEAIEECEKECYGRGV